LILNYSYTKDPKLLDFFKVITNYYFNRIADDYVPYWDLIYTSRVEAKDSSAASIAL